jgi:hypothetical protein
VSKEKESFVKWRSEGEMTEAEVAFVDSLGHNPLDVLGSTIQEKDQGVGFYGGYHSRDFEVDALTKENAALRAKVEKAEALAEAAGAHLHMFRAVGKSLALFDPQWGRSTGDYFQNVIKKIEVALTTYKGEEGA